MCQDDSSKISWETYYESNVSRLAEVKVLKLILLKSKNLPRKYHTYKKTHGSKEKSQNKYFQLSENKNITHQIFWGTAKVMLIEKCLALHTYIRKEIKS